MKFLKRIDSIRGFAAFSVALGHTMNLTLAYGGRRLPLFDQQSWSDFMFKLITGITSGEVAVIAFFVVSGIVLGRFLDSQKVTTVAGYVSFLIRRAFRLYPAHIVSIIVIVIVGSLYLTRPGPDFSLFHNSSPSLLANIAGLLTGAIFDPVRFTSVVGNMMLGTWSMNWVVWSLYVEVCAAAFLPIFHYCSRKENAKLDLFMLVVLIGLSYINWNHLWSRYLFMFYVGMMVETTGIKWAKLIERTVGIKWGLFISFVATVMPFTLAVVVFDNNLPMMLWEAFGVFTMLGLIIRSEDRPVLAILEHRTLRSIGRLTFSFFLWHFFILTIAARWIFDNISPTAWQEYNWEIFGIAVLVTMSLAMAIAPLSYRYIELPFNDLGRVVVRLWKTKGILART